MDNYLESMVPKYHNAIRTSLLLIEQIASGSSRFVYFRDTLKDQSRMTEGELKDSFVFYLDCESGDFETSIGIKSNLMSLELLAYTVCFDVGGVEYNTIGVLESLDTAKAIFFQGLASADNRSMASTALKCGVPTINVLSVPSHVADPLTEICLKLSPKILWICNWSLQDSALEPDNLEHISRNGTRIVDQRSYDDEVGWINSLSSISDQYITTYIATNEKIRLKLVSKYQIAKEKIRVIYPILKKNCELIATPPNIPTHVLIGRIDQQKRVDRFIELATSFSNLGFLDRFLVYGTGDSLTQKQIANLRLSNLVFKGKSNLEDIQKDQSSLVLLSDFEGMPMVVLEALSAGIPVFATNVGDLNLLRDSLDDALRDYLHLIPTDSDNAFILDSFLAWRTSIETLWAREDRNKVRQWIHDNFSVSKSTVEHKRVFGDLK